MMYYIAVASYATVNRVEQLKSWAYIVIPAMLCARCTKDFVDAIHDPETYGLKGAFLKCKKRIFACVIAITVTGIVAWVKKYYR